MTVDDVICDEAARLRREGRDIEASRVLELRFIDWDHPPDWTARRAIAMASQYAKTGDPVDFVQWKSASYRWRHGKSDADKLARAQERLAGKTQ